MTAFKQFRVEPDRKFKLKDRDPGDTAGFKSKKEANAKERLTEGIERLRELQERLYAHDRWALLIIFQAMDAAGKDSTIEHVMSGVNPQGCQVYSFKQPSAEELSLRFNQALGYDMNALEFAVVGGDFYGIDLTNYTPDLDYRSLKDAHFPWAVEKMAEFAVEKALSGEGTPKPPNFRELMLR